MAKKKRETEDVLTGEKFDAMTDAQRAKITAGIEAETPRHRRARSRPLNAEEQTWWRKVQKKLGRPKLGKHGARAVTVTVEKALLKNADAYAKANGMKRSELFAASVAEKIGAR